MYTAIVIGSTGLVGKALVQQLLAHNTFDVVKTFSRRSLQLQHPKLQEHLIHFDALHEWQHLLTGDVLFITMGTTIKQAGSQKAQYLIDVTYPFEVAQVAAAQGVQKMILLTSAGANAQSRMFYLRIKGELEAKCSQLPFAQIDIIQPGSLTGPRAEKRLGERWSIVILHFLNAFGIATAYRPIADVTVAKAMINAALAQHTGVARFSLKEVFALAGK